MWEIHYTLIMIGPILATKLYIPSPVPNLVPRPQLINRLNEGWAKGCKLTLLSASAGFGKTTLLGEWLGCLGIPGAWLSLEKEDNDPGRFWTYVQMALQKIHPGLRKSVFELQYTSSSSQIDDILTPLINEIAALPDLLLLVLDDYHVIDSVSIQEAMIFLLEHLPAQLHIVIASRADPPWPLAYWRSKGLVNEIRVADLRFRSEEANDFLIRTMKLDLSALEIFALEERTEGWVAGLQMAALSLQGREDAHDFIKAFTGSNRYIFDYLLDEVIGRQSTVIQDFLLKTSMLEHLSAPLCDRILGRSDSHEILIKLEQANLFLIPLDDERQWYRYHHLFADLLRHRLEQIDSEQIIKLHRRASQWYAANHFPSESVHHALETGDFKLVNELVSGNALAIVEHADLLSVLRRFEEIPIKEISSKHWLCVAYAWVKVYTNPTADLEIILQQGEQCLSGNENEAEKYLINNHMAAIRAYAAWTQGEADKALELVRKGLKSIPENDRILRPYLLDLEGLAWQYLGNLTAAIQCFNAALAASDGTNIYFDIITKSNMAFTCLLQGSLREAFSLCQHNLDMAEKSIRSTFWIPVLATTYGTMGIVHFEWNEVESALTCARESVALAQKWKQADALHFTLHNLSRALFATNNIEEAFAVNDQAMRLAANVSPWYYRLSVCNEAWLNLAKGDVRAAARRLEEIEPQVIDKNGTFLMVKISLLNAQGKYPEVLAALDGPIGELEQRGEYWISMNLMLFQALALQALDREGEALGVIRRCLAKAAPEGFIRMYLEKGAPMVRLLRQAMDQRIETEYVNNLLSAFTILPKPDKTIKPISGEVISQKASRYGELDDQALNKELTEPLSKRELEILHLLEGSLNTPEIGRELYISVGTVRTHIKNIYRKLGVNRRMEAIQRAKDLELI